MGDSLGLKIEYKIMSYRTCDIVGIIKGSKGDIDTVLKEV